MINRRKLITTSASSLLVASSTKSFADCNDKPKTPSQVTGPFYKNTFDQKNSDLTYNNGRASGEIIKITGRIMDVNCNPLANCKISVWQANVYGKYNHPGDSSDRPMDPFFNGYSKFNNDENGQYTFLTIKPGSYQAMGTWVRPPHIHIKIDTPIGKSLVTQLYFSGNPLNKKDFLYKQTDSPELLELELNKDSEDKIFKSTFDFII